MKFHLLLFSLFILGCTASKKSVSTDSLDQVMLMMQGSYDSEAQSIADSTYYNISLHMYPIWKNKGHYLYVEQAIATAQDKPYRVRIYQLEKTPEGVSSKIYKIPNEKEFIGHYKSPELFNKISPSDLEEREGCTVYLKKDSSGNYSGSTDTDKCKSSLRGASYATSIVSFNGKRIESWDQGFDSSGTQVWGATEGGYIFIKK